MKVEKRNSQPKVKGSNKQVAETQKISDISGGSSIGRTPVIGENIEFSCMFLNKVKLTPLFSAYAYAPSSCTFWIRHWTLLVSNSMT